MFANFSETHFALLLLQKKKKFYSLTQVTLLSNLKIFPKLKLSQKVRFSWLLQAYILR